MRFLLLLLFPIAALAGPAPLDASRRAEWILGSTMGVSNGIPTSLAGGAESYNVLDFGADNTAVTDSKAAFTFLLNTNRNNIHINVPAGYYDISSQISKDGSRGYRILRGASKETTFLICTNGFLISDSQTFSDFNVNTNLAKGATNLSITPGGDLSSYIGKVFKVSGSNRRADVDIWNVNGGDRDMYCFTVLVSVVDATNAVFYPPLTMPFYSTNVVTFAVNSSPVMEFFGIEDLTILGTNIFEATPPASANLISMFGAKNCWIQRCRIENINGFPITILGGIFNEFCHNDFIQTVSGANTAVIISSGEGNAAIYNNYSYGGSPFVEWNASSASVISYNYATNAVSDDTHVGNPFDNHAPHTHMNLWEGNYGTMYQSDSYFGSSSDQTLHRNFFGGYDPIKNGGSALPRCVDLGRWSQRYNIIGNVLGDPARNDWHYYLTNQFYGQGLALIFRFGFPYPGNTSYGKVGFASRTPDADWRWPGDTKFGGTITSATGSGTTVDGDFSNVNNEDVLLLRSSSNTNYYYPFQTDFPRLAADGDGTSMSLTFNKSINFTNGHTVWVIGPDSFYSLTLAYTNDFIIAGNYDRTNNAQMNVDGYMVTNSYYLTSRPSWWTNKSGGFLAWPPVDPSTGEANQTNWPAWQRIYGVGASTSGPTPRIKGIKLRASVEGANSITGPWETLLTFLEQTYPIDRPTRFIRSTVEVTPTN